LILAIVVLLVLWLVLDETEKRVNSRDAP
jgi:hypothetical protein